MKGQVGFSSPDPIGFPGITIPNTFVNICSPPFGDILIFQNKISPVKTTHIGLFLTIIVNFFAFLI